MTRGSGSIARKADGEFAGRAELVLVAGLLEVVNAAGLWALLSGAFLLPGGDSAVNPDSPGHITIVVEDGANDVFRDLAEALDKRTLELGLVLAHLPLEDIPGALSAGYVDGHLLACASDQAHDLFGGLYLKADTALTNH